MFHFLSERVIFVMLKREEAPLRALLTCAGQQSALSGAPAERNISENLIQK